MGVGVNGWNKSLCNENHRKYWSLSGIDAATISQHKHRFDGLGPAWPARFTTLANRWPALASIQQFVLPVAAHQQCGLCGSASPCLYFDSCAAASTRVLVVVATQVTATVFAARSIVRAHPPNNFDHFACVSWFAISCCCGCIACSFVHRAPEPVAPARGCVSDLRHISGGSVESSRDAVYATAEPHIDLVREKRRNGKVQVASLASSGEKTSTVFIRRCCNISSSLRHDTTCQPPGHTCTLSSPLELASSITLDIIPTTWTHLRTELCTDLLLSDCLASVPSGVPLQLGSSATARVRLRAAWRRKPSQQLDCTLRGCVQLLPTLHAILEQCLQLFVQQLAGLGIVCAILPGSQTLTHTKTSSFACR